MSSVSSSSLHLPLLPHLSLKPPRPLPHCPKVRCWCPSSTSRSGLPCSTDLCLAITPALSRLAQPFYCDEPTILVRSKYENMHWLITMSINTYSSTQPLPYHVISLQSPSQLSHSLQSRGVAHSFTTSQLQSAVTAAALGSGSGKHAAARPLHQGAKVSAGSSNQGNVAAWRKQSGGNTGR